MQISLFPYIPYKSILYYGIALGILLFVIQFLEVYFLLFDYQIEFLLSATAILFMLLGIWLSNTLAKSTVVYVNDEKSLDKLVLDGSNISNQNNVCGISKREMDVLKLMARGYSNDEIASELYISINTVKTHSSNIFNKLEVRRRVQAIEKAKYLKIID